MYRNNSFSNYSPYGFSGSTQNFEYIEIDKQSDMVRDTVSDLRVLDKNIFVVSSWDGSLRIYEIKSSKAFIQIFFKEFNQPITAIEAHLGQQVCFVALFNKEIIVIDPRTEQIQGIHKSNDYISQLKYMERENVLLAFSAKGVDMIDLSNDQSIEYRYDFSHIKTDFIDNQLVSIFTHNKFSCYYLEDLFENKKLRYEENELKSQLTTVTFGKNCQIIYTGGADGRISRRDLTNSHKDETFIFLAHTKHQNCYPVNDCLFFSSNYKQYLISAGSDNICNIWDMDQKNPIAKLQFEGPVTNVCYIQQSESLIICQGYEFHKGIKGVMEITYNPNIKIFQLKSL